LEGVLETVLSGFSTSSNFFRVESGVAFNVLTTGLFRIQQSSHASASTLCLSKHQVKLAEQGVDQDRTKDARPCLNESYCLSITLEKMWGCKFSPYLESIRGMLTATQRYKVEEIPKAIYLPIVFSNSTKADTVGRGDCLISFGLPAWRPFLFFSSPPSLPQK